MSEDALKQLLKMLIRHSRERLNLSREQILNYYNNPSGAISVPINVFSTPISPAESICKYLKEECNLTYHEIGVVLDRDERSIWVSYHNSLKKQKSRFKIPKDSICIPLSLFKRSKLSVFETAVYYLVKNCYMTCKKIAEELNKQPSTVWTVYNRARDKLGEIK
jgi:DNA-binding CsgD family transcriptional regulator